MPARMRDERFIDIHRMLGYREDDGHAIIDLQGAVRQLAAIVEEELGRRR